MPRATVLKSIWSRVARGAFAVGLAGAAISLAYTCRQGVETDLYALLDPTRQSVLRALADNVGGQLRILLEGPDFASLEASAADFRTCIATHVRGDVGRPREPQREAGTLRETLAALAPRSGGLLRTRRARCCRRESLRKWPAPRRLRSLRVSSHRSFQ